MAAALVGPESMVVTPDGRTIDFATGAGTLNALDIASGKVTAVGDPNAAFSGPGFAFGQET